MYSDASLDAKVILFHGISSATGMQVSRKIRLVEEIGDLPFIIRWCGLSPSDGTIEPLEQVVGDVPQLISKLLKRTATPTSLAEKAYRELGLPSGRV